MTALKSILSIDK